MDATTWDDRYRSAELVWGGPPNRWVREQLADLDPGRAVDLACGEGRNALWLAERGWQVTGVDFSAVAIDKARTLDADRRASWVVADVLTFRPNDPVELVIICYLQLPADQRRTAMRNAASALAPGGTIFVVAHDSRNLTDGTGGPSDPTVLYTAADVVGDIDGLGLSVEQAGEVLREVADAERPAIDCLLRAVRPTSAP